MKVYLLETKTTAEDISPGSTFWKRTILDPQLSIYIPALRKLGHDPVGAVYDVLRKPSQQPSGVPLLDDDGLKIVHNASGERVRTKDGKKWRQSGDAKQGLVLQTREETPEEFRDRCLDAIGADPSRYYARGTVVRLEADEKEAAFDTWSTASHMREARKLNVYPRNPDSCMSWSRECEYLSVCAGMASIDDPVLFRHEASHVELDGLHDLSLLTQSSMRCYRSCPRKFLYRYVMGQRTLKTPETLSTGKSVHAALDVYRQRGGDLEAAKAALTTEDAFTRAKEEAMLMGYAARWGAPQGVISVEEQFRIPLVNPETGASSRTFELGGRVDAILDADFV